MITFSGPNGMSELITEQKMYSDSTPMVKTMGWDRIVKQADTMTVTGGSMAQFVTAMFLVDAITTSGGNIKTLVMPYLPGARQDRVNPTGDVLVTALSVAKMIWSAAFEKIVVLDPHSGIILGPLQYNNVQIFPQEEVAKMLPNVYAGVIAADKGGQARAEEMAEALSLPVFYGGKTRDVSNGKLTGFTLQPLVNIWGKGNHYLVVDDICDGGGTFLGLADKIAEQGATADLYVSHGIFSKGVYALKEKFNTIYTTDSLDQSGNTGVTVLPVVKEMETYHE